jgi:enterochelin esterase-like enzyme
LATPIQTQFEDQLPQGPLPPAASRLEKHERFASRFLPGERAVTVYLPPGYDAEAERRYPLLILHDGQNLFDPETSFVRGRTWQIAEGADAALAAGEIEPLIIAGVANAGERRLAEYTPTRNWRMGGGDAARYADLLIRELLPFLHERYRLRSGPEETAVGGSSLGGLVSLWLGLRYPETFGKLAVLSPSVWWNHRSILNAVNDLAPALPRHPRLWLDVGTAEGRRTVADAELLDARLRTHGWRPGRDLHFEVVPGGSHDEAAWARRVAPMLRFLFPLNS